MEVLLRKSSKQQNQQNTDPESEKIARHEESITIPTTNSINDSRTLGPIPILKQSTEQYKKIMQAEVQSSNSQNSNSNSEVNTPGTWRLQIAVVPSQENAIDLLNKAQNKIGGQLAYYQSYTEPHTFRNGKRHFKAQFVGIDSKSDVYSACRELKKTKFGCLVIKN